MSENRDQSFPKHGIDASTPDERNPSRQTRPPSKDACPIVGIGASAGGLAALRKFFAGIPDDSGMAFVIVVHLSPKHKSHLAELLQPYVKMPVRQVTETVKLEPNHVYVIPPNANLNSVDTHLRLSELEEHRRERAPVDHFFRTLAKTRDGDSIGIILTGTGSDGTLGLRKIKEKGGLTIVQDPSDAEFDGMPQSALSSGLVDLVLPLSDMADAIMRYESTEPRLTITETEEKRDDSTRQLLQKLFGQLRARTGRDFSCYKRTTIGRRIQRRMQLCQIEEFADYVDLLRKQPSEARVLADDLLVTVTSFFRDREVYETLEKEVIPKLFEGKEPEDEIRVWSVGCATGEEAYSLAMLLLEEAARRETSPKIQVFASDLHLNSLRKAREGLYLGDIETDVSPQRLKRFFTLDNGGYRVNGQLRDSVIFSPHNLMDDPPFSKMDLITCRNLLIYIRREAQRSIVDLLHYALRAEGYLLLGTSETLEGKDLFEVKDKRHCLFQKRDLPTPNLLMPLFSKRRSQTIPEPGGAEPPAGRMTHGALHQHMLERYSLPSALISADDKIVHLSKSAGRYLLYPGGEVTSNVNRIIREELRIELRAALQNARESGKPCRSAPVEVHFNGEAAFVTLHTRPSGATHEKGFVLIIFDERPEASGAYPSAFTEGTDAGSHQALRAELELTKKRLQAAVEEHDTSQEEMRASNEEMQSTNEELRSTLEELETSKEELQSMNEELQTVNQENRHKVEELALLTDDLQNLLTATDIATLFLNRKLCILRFTEKLEKLFSVRPSDRGRPIADLRHRLGYDDLEKDARRVLDQLVPVQREVEDQSGHWYLTRVMPYRRADDRIGGVVITFVDITERKKSEMEVHKAKEYAEQIIEALPGPLLVLSHEMEILSANGAFCEQFQQSSTNIRGRSIYKLAKGEWDYPDLRELLENVLPEIEVVNGYEVEHKIDNARNRALVLNARLLKQPKVILLGIHDISKRHEAEVKLRRNEERLQKMTDIEGIGLMTLDSAGVLVDANKAFLKMIGYSREELVARKITWRSLTSPQFVDLSLRQMEKLKRTGRIGPYEKEYIRKDGSESWMLIVGAAMEDGTIVKYCLDINDRKEAEQALHLSQDRVKDELAAMKRLHELVARLLVSTDVNSALGEVLEASTHITGTTMGMVRIVDKETGALKIVAHRGFQDTCLEAFDTVTVEDDCSCGRAVRCGNRVIIEDVEKDPVFAPYREDAAKAGFRAVQSTPLLSRGGELLGVLSTHYEQPHQPSERDMRLLDLYARQAADFIESVRVADANRIASRRKDEFLATLAHELRNPLAPIVSGIELLKEGGDGAGNIEEIREMMDTQCQHLLSLVDELLDMSRISSGKLKLRKRNATLDEIVKIAVDASRPHMDSEGQKFRLSLPEEPVQLHVDPHRIAQVISNLLNNAAKYTPSGGEIELAAQRDGGALKISVRDTGVGLTSRELEDVFEMFAQVEHTFNDGMSGLGIGLTLVKSLTELHGGTVTGKSDGQGKGCTFIINLPIGELVAPKAKEPEEARPAEGRPQKTLRVLIADDNAAALWATSSVIRKLGHEVCTASEGEEALKLGADFRPDVIFLDIGMPGMDGYETAEAIRKAPWGKDAKLVALTGWSMEQHKKRIREVGFDNHLVKPAAATDLRDLLERIR